MLVILVGLGDAALGRPPTVWGWVGILLVVVGCFLVPLRSLRQFSIVIGVILAFCIHREQGWAIRLPATWLITMGLLIIGIEGH